VLIFPEGTRVRPGPLGTPKRGIGRLALESGAPIVPLAVIGTEDVRKGWRIRPPRITIRAGRPLTYPRVERPSKQLAQAVTDRIWPCVALQWEWLGGLPPLRTAAVVGAGSMGTAIAVLLARAGLDVQLGCRGADQAVRLREEGANAAYLPDAELPESLRVTTTAEIEFGGIDLVVLAVPSREVPQVVAQVGARVGGRSAVLLLAKGLVAPLGSRPTDYVQARVAARAVAYLGGPAHAAEMVSHGAAIVLASADEDLRHQLAGVLTRAGLDVEQTDDVIGAELGGCAKNAATLAASVAATVSNNAAGGAAGRVFAEAYRLAIAAGARPDTLVGLAGVGDLVGTALAPGSRNRRAGKLLAEGVPADRVPSLLGCAAESLDAVPLLVGALDRAGVDCPATRGLAALVAGETTAERWIEELEAGRPAGGGASPGTARLASDG
ncbi:MAG: 1-acyl-sn-glycerol-3-phosphate acyltransferase, partial [Actinomycetota bacterium]|nr:1-acyl-sn-glycerol-3-phosphate acyltransferase [Actinomycetota bacterium]